ncbi:helix-turn-helix domain-containing protein [Actinomyces bowdenii]|uniref:helix-turn-helix domain-containing protein n=1 Tax=Actinomyces bowdenii TaxID=131109 RepID=UPI00214CFBC3|nr:helix-turn-helix domain-containing protein [Actinomyces bowdenii]MCR2051476.1 helix-turn-helix domain-containing protein [Actinomyces bowdenii]
MTVVLAYTINEAARVTGLSADFLRRAIKATDPDMHLPAKMAGSRYVILREDLERWLQERPEA